jgi:hypothetical protein
MSKISITKNIIDVESKKIIDSIIEKIFKDYKNIPHNEFTEDEAYEQIEDLISIKEIINRIIIRRNKSYKN